MSLSPTESGSVLTARSLLQFLCLPLSLPTPPTHSLSQTIKHFKKLKINKIKFHNEKSVKNFQSTTLASVLTAAPYSMSSEHLRVSRFKACRFPTKRTPPHLREKASPFIQLVKPKTFRVTFKSSLIHGSSHRTLFLSHHHLPSRQGHGLPHHLCPRLPSCRPFSSQQLALL